MNNELLYQIALDFVKGIGSSLAKQLVAYTGSPEAIFKEEGKALLKIPGINDEKVFLDFICSNMRFSPYH